MMNHAHVEFLVLRDESSACADDTVGIGVIKCNVQGSEFAVFKDLLNYTYFICFTGHPRLLN